MKVAVIFDNFGPYHLVRLQAAARVCELTAVEVTARSKEYAWERWTASTPSPHFSPIKAERAEGRHEFNPPAFKIVTLLEGGTSSDGQRRKLVQSVEAALAAAKPDVVFIPGWSSKAALAALAWCMRKGIPSVAMSESTERDEVRSIWREAVKRRIVGLCTAALVGGTPHRDYLLQLGMPAGRIFLGYDAVDNCYFGQGAKESRRQKDEVRKKHRLPENYFLASARFIEKKNLPRLIQAYTRYRELAAIPSPDTRHSSPWSLVLLGDGPLRKTLNSQLSTLNLHEHVQLPGFKQYPELPAYYGLANAFIHASTTEQWGLVVNEAMASGLPVLVSNRCGCAKDLVQEGANGFTFNPCNAEELAQLMFRVSGFGFRVSDFGAASSRIIADWGPERFAQGLKSAVDKVLEEGPIKPALNQCLILKALLAI